MEFTHFDKEGNAAMVDVGGKEITRREAVAEGYIGVSETCFQMIQEGSMKKGDVLGVARIAGIMGAKKTSELIPLCHALNLTKVSVDFDEIGKMDGKNPQKWYIRARCTARCEGKTGVEMEALTGVQIALLTIYDMCKAVDKSMEMTDISLIYKEGGASGIYERKND
nr:cyclic pyranopterin monophosphate synthase MoaC [uncultured Sellimonas sp.]